MIDRQVSAFVRELFAQQTLAVLLPLAQSRDSKAQVRPILQRN